MKAAWYEKQGAAADVLVVGEMPAPEPGPGEVRIRVTASGINPGDVKKRQDRFGIGMPYLRVIPHSDGAGIIERVGEGVLPSRVGERVWCYGAQSYRPFGTGAEFVVVPSDQAVFLPIEIAFEQGACLGIPGITAYQAVHVAGPVQDRAVLVQGGAGAVGQFAVGLARHAGARVIATVRAKKDEAMATRAGAHHVVCSGGFSAQEIANEIKAHAPNGVHHIVEVSFDANIAIDEQVLAQGGSIAAFATGNPTPTVPFWPLLFKNTRLYLLGSDDFSAEVKRQAATTLNGLLQGGWPGPVIARRYPLDQIAEAHVCVEAGKEAGRVLVVIG